MTGPKLPADPPAPGIRWCSNHQGWEWRWIDPRERIVWHPVPDAPADPEQDVEALHLAADIYGCKPEDIENYKGRETEAFGMCAPCRGKA